MMQLIPVKEHLDENADFAAMPECAESLQMTVDFYKRVGFNPPWISYYVQHDGKLVGCAAYVGKPNNNRVEIAYAVFTSYQRQGIGTLIAGMLVDLAKQNEPSVTVIAHTLPQENFSTKILQKNQFKLVGTAMDDDEGEVWEWEWQK